MRDFLFEFFVAYLFTVGLLTLLGVPVIHPIVVAVALFALMVAKYLVED